MAFRLKLSEPIGKGFRRISQEQFAIALAEVTGATVSAAGVHQTRKALKRLRALLRLVGPALGQKVLKKRNAAVRDIARMLAGHRDRAVILQTLAMLQTVASEQELAAIAQYKSHIAGSDAETGHELDAPLRDAVRRRLAAEAAAFEYLKIKKKGFSAIETGLGKTYKMGREAVKIVHRAPSDEAFHELRKAVQAHWRQVSIIARAWPEEADVRIAAARELSEILGDDHDLSMLISAISKSTLPPDVSQALEALARKQQKTLRAAAAPRLKRLYAEAPRAYVERVSAYWRAARDIADIPGRNSAEAAPTPKSAEVSQNDKQAITRNSAPRLARIRPASRSQGDA